MKFTVRYMAITVYLDYLHYIHLPSPPILTSNSLRSFLYSYRTVLRYIYFLRIETTAPQEIKETCKSQEVPEMYDILSFLLQSYMSRKNASGGETVQPAHTDSPAQKMCGELQGCNFCESLARMEWAFQGQNCLQVIHAFTINLSFTITNPNKLIGLLTWFQVQPSFEPSGLIWGKQTFGLSPEEKSHYSI